jgi:outer membrane protein assembly factor BamB
MRFTIPLLFCSLICNLFASDWPTWRGPNRDGLSTETGLLKAWPAGGPELAWKSDGCGVGYSSVSVANGRLFTMGDGTDASHVRAYNEKDGKPAWVSAAIGKPGGSYKGTRCTPTVDGDLLYALGQFGDFVCLQAKDGEEVWRKNLTTDFGGRYSGWQYTESPLVDGNKVLVTPGGKNGAVVALDKKTGALLWQSKEFTDGAHYSSLVPVNHGGTRQYVQLTAESVASVDAATGRLLWRAPRRGQTAVIPTPIFSDGIVYVTSGYGVGCNAFKVAGSAAPEEIYANKVMANHHGGVILKDGHLYGFSDGKGWVCQNLKTGELVWSDRGVGKGAIAYADGHFVIRSEGGQGTVALIEATTKGYVEKGRFNQPNRAKENSWAHPVIANGRLYLRDQDVLLAYDVKGK